MPWKCWVSGCPSGHDRAGNGKRHFFKAPACKTRREKWSTMMPHQTELLPTSRLCDLHFEQKCILKSFDLVINGCNVSIPREKWCLSTDAVPTVVATVLEDDIMRTDSVVESCEPVEDIAASGMDYDTTTEVAQGDIEESLVSFDDGLSIYFEPNELCMPLNQITSVVIDDKVVSTNDGIEDMEPGITFDALMTETVNATSYFGQIGQKPPESKCHECRTLSSKLRQRNRQLRLHKGIVRNLKAQLHTLTKKVNQLEQQVSKYDNLSGKMKLAVSQAVNCGNTKSSKGNRYDKEWIVDCLLIKCKSPAAYRLLRNGEYLPLPCVSTLTRYIKGLRPEFGFNANLCVALTEKLASIPERECRGMLMFEKF